MHTVYSPGICSCGMCCLCCFVLLLIVVLKGMLVCIRYQLGALSHKMAQFQKLATCHECVIHLCINSQSASMDRPSQALLQQWLLRQDSLKASKGGKQSNGEVAKVWLELKSHALQNLFAWQDAIVMQDMLPSAADIRSACKVRYCATECMAHRPAQTLVLGPI